ncbi:MAG: hypothetical protein Q9176_000416 [Flavoplaca citrina]
MGDFTQPPTSVSFDALRLLNGDCVAPKNGFPFCTHCDAGIFSYILTGELTHRDSMTDNGATGSSKDQFYRIRRGDEQFTTGGTGKDGNLPQLIAGRCESLPNFDSTFPDSHMKGSTFNAVRELGFGQQSGGSPQAWEDANVTGTPNMNSQEQSREHYRATQALTTGTKTSHTANSTVGWYLRK